MTTTTLETDSPLQRLSEEQIERSPMSSMRSAIGSTPTSATATGAISRA